MPEKKYAFQWKDGGIVVDKTWAYDQETAWDNATRLCRPASLRNSTDEVVQEWLAKHGDVVEID